LKGYDYSLAGAYFVTINVQDRECLLGEIEDGVMELYPAGKMVDEVWCSLPEKYITAVLDEFVIMPNHFHFIVFLTNEPFATGVDDPPDAVQSPADPGQARGPAPTMADGDDVRPSLSDVVGWFKSLTTAKYRHGVRDEYWPPFPGRVWQRNYYEHIIRNERSLNAIRAYIENNPANWQQDELYEA